MKIYFFFLLLFLINISYSQQLSQSETNNLLGKYFEYYDIKKTYVDNNYCDQRLNRCITIITTPKWKTDFNGDGKLETIYLLKDINDFYHLLVVSFNEDKIIHIYNYSIELTRELSINSVRNGEINVTYSSKKYKTSDLIKSENLTFKLIDGNFTVKSYEYCPLSVMKKNIFKPIDSLKLYSNLSLNDKFDEKKRERFKYEKTDYDASLYGCESLSLTLIKTDYDPLKNKELLKDRILEALKFYKKTTYFKSVFKNMLKYINENKGIIQNNIQYNKEGKQASVKLFFELQKNWSATIQLYGLDYAQEGGTLRITLNQRKKNQPVFQNDFEAIRRKKELMKIHKLKNQ